jgi:hypothetical protein
MSAAIAFITGDPDLPQNAKDLVLQCSEHHELRKDRDGQRRHLIRELLKMLDESVPPQSEATSDDGSNTYLQN